MKQRLMQSQQQGLGFSIQGLGVRDSLDTGLEARGFECYRAIRSYAPHRFQNLKSLVWSSLRAVAESERSMTRMRAAAAVVDQGITEMQTKVSIYMLIIFSLYIFRKCSRCDETRGTMLNGGLS